MVPDRYTAFDCRLFLAGMSLRTYVSVPTFPPRCPLPLTKGGASRFLLWFQTGIRPSIVVCFLRECRCGLMFQFPHSLPAVPSPCQGKGWGFFLEAISVLVRPIVCESAYIPSPTIAADSFMFGPTDKKQGFPKTSQPSGCYPHASQRVMRAPSALSRPSILQ